MNCTLTEKSRSLLLESRVSKDLWNETLQTAAYILNTSPTTALLDKTPAEMWFGYKHSIKHMQVFGYNTYLLKPKHLRHKFDKKCNIYLFTGYITHGYGLAAMG